MFSRACSHVRGSAGFNPSNFNQRAGSTPGTGRRIRWENPLRSVVRRGGEGQSPAPLLRMHDNLSTSFAKRTGQRSAIRRVEGQPAALKEAEWNAVERGLRRERRAGAPRMYRADKVREEPGRGQGAAQEHWAAYRTKTEKGPEGTNNGLPSHPPPSTQIRISSSSMSALGRMEPGAAGATQAGRHRPPCRDGHGMQPALRVCRPRRSDETAET